MSERIEWLTVPEAAAYAKKTPHTIGNALRAGELDGEQPKKGAHWRVDRRAVDAWIRGEQYVEQVTTGRKRRNRR